MTANLYRCRVADEAGSTMRSKLRQSRSEEEADFRAARDTDVWIS